jgi:F0F1-type ATP synthase membrane subunit b/b'
LPLTKNGARREVIEEMIEELQAAHKQDLLALAYSFAALVLQKKEDCQWLKRRFEMLSDILEDSWAFQDLKERAEKRAREEARQQAKREVEQRVEQAKREAEQRVEQAKREAEQRVEQAKREVERELSQKMEQEVEQLKQELMQQLARQMEREVARMQEEEARKSLQQGRLVQERETLEQYVQSHFPALLPLLRERTESIQNPGTLRQLLFHLLEARGEDEARSLILTANDQTE